MRPKFLILSGLFFATVACNDVFEPLRGESGFVEFITLRDSATTSYVLAPIAAFYSRGDLGYDFPDNEFCQTATYVPDGNVPVSFSIGAGPIVELAHPAGLDTLYQQSSFGLITYQLAGTTPIFFTPGDTMQVIVPGSGDYPAVTTSIKTAEPFTHDPIEFPEEGHDLTVNWTGTATAGTRMMAILRYNSGETDGPLYEQVSCIWNDDGSGTVPAHLLTGWLQATQRQNILTRFRMVEIPVASRTRFTLTASYSSPMEYYDPT